MGDFDDKVQKKYNEIKDDIFDEIHEQLTLKGLDGKLGPGITIIIQCQIRAIALHEVRTLEKIDQLLKGEGESLDIRGYVGR